MSAEQHMITTHYGTSKRTSLTGTPLAEMEMERAAKRRQIIISVFVAFAFVIIGAQFFV